MLILTKKELQVDIAALHQDDVWKESNNKPFQYNRNDINSNLSQADNSFAHISKKLESVSWSIGS